jgi:NTP pyrophosphatase (non-canonical NTP hydrolase)
MASEQKCFEFADVTDAITQKMIRRHPHVFADPKLRDEFLNTDLWQRIKAEERAERGAREDGSRLDDVPVALPALTRAVKLQKHAAEVGFDWPSLVPVLAKAEEEIAELKAAISDRANGSDQDHAKRVAEEFGDLLFVMANRGISALILKRACARPTRSSRAVSRASKPRSPRKAASRKNPRSRKWIGCGTRPRLRSRRARNYSAASLRRAGPASRASLSRFSGGTRMRNAVIPSSRTERVTTSQFS